MATNEAVMSWQPIINAMLGDEFDRVAAAKRLSEMTAEASLMGDEATALRTELTLVWALLHLKQDSVTESTAHRTCALKLLEEDTSAYSPPDLVRIVEQAGVLAACTGDLELGERLFARSGEEIDRLFRAAPVGDLLRNTYHRGLAYKLAGRDSDARPHIELATHLADRILRRYEGRHPEANAIRALGAAMGADSFRKLPFWFDLGGVPVPCHVIGSA